MKKTDPGRRGPVRKNTLAMLALCLGLWAVAAAARADDAYKQCLDDSDGTNPAWATCGWQWVAREDARFQAVWKQVAEPLEEGRTRDDLLAEQRAWVLYREKACRYYANGDRGREGEVLDYPACLAEVIATRARQLEVFGTR